MYKLEVIGSLWVVAVCNSLLEESWPCSTIGIDFHVGSSDNPKRIIITGKCEKALADFISRIAEKLEADLEKARQDMNRDSVRLFEAAIKEADELRVKELKQG